jgi:predicted DNA-binding transcriptional regulator AlpA
VSAHNIRAQWFPSSATRGAEAPPSAGKRLDGDVQEAYTSVRVEPMLTAKDVAEVLRLPAKRVYEVVGHLAVRLAPRTLRWRPSDINQWIAARASGG